VDSEGVLAYAGLLAIMPRSAESRPGSLLEPVNLSAVNIALRDSDDGMLGVRSGVAVAVDETQYIGEVWRDVSYAELLCFLAAPVRKRTIMPLVQAQIRQ
jgi:hypothetical protein